MTIEINKAFAIVVTILLLMGAATPIVLSASADGKVDYCWVERYQSNNLQPEVYVVYGHRPWRSDVNMATAGTAEAAEEMKQKLCPK